MQETELAYLRFLGEMKELRTDTLQVLFGYNRCPGDVLSYHNTCKRRDNWRKLGLVEVETFDRWAWTRLTKKGLAYAELPYKVGTWSHNLTHQYQVTNLAMRLQCKFRDEIRDWRGDRSFRVAKGDTERYPDLFSEILIRDAWQPIVIEVQLSRVMTTRITEKVRYLRETFGYVYYFVNDITRPGALAARNQLRESDNMDFGIYDLDTLEVC